MNLLDKAQKKSYIKMAAYQHKVTATLILRFGTRPSRLVT